MRKIYELTKAQLLNIPRNRSLLFATIAFPLIFIGVFGIAMPDGVQSNSSMSIGIISRDVGIPTNTTVLGANGTIMTTFALQDQFLNIVESITYEDNKTSVFDVEYYDPSAEDQALSDIQTSDITALLILPEDFSLGVLAAIRANFEDNMNMTTATSNWYNYPKTTYQTDVTIRGDPTVQTFSITSSVLTSIVTAYFELGAIDEDGHQIILDTNVSVDDFSVFDYILPGLVIFGILQNLGLTASFSMRDVESGLLRRLRISRITSTEYTLSLVLNQLVVTVIQVPIFFAVAVMFGFPATPKIVNAYVFAILVSLSVTGLGLIVASFAKNQDAAGSISTMVAVPMAFLAGSFFVVPDVILVENLWNGNSFGLFDLLSAKPAIEGIRLILIGGQSLYDVRYQLILLTVLTVAYLSLGLFLYARKHLTPED